ncbi:MAG TPA: hypothetical protein VFZ34_25775 [Blastocatellia bacterium]|nr:hypothetical protein [Blastocatellia bacterium]
MRIAEIIVGMFSIYVAVGLLFALFFVTRGVERLDPSVQQSTWGFRLVIVPGVIALWPLLWRRWWRGAQHLPTENNAHRKAAQ